MNDLRVITIRWRFCALSLLAAALLITGCGGCDDETSNNGTTDASTDVRDQADVVDTRDDAVQDTGDLEDTVEDTVEDTDASACGSNCDALPSAYCDDDTAVTYTGAGVCDEDAGQCDFSGAEQRTDCAASGLTCDLGACVNPPCTDADLRTETTLFDQTALPNETSPIRNGFDPLLKDDSVRIHIDANRLSGSGDLEANIRLANLEFTADTLLINGQAATPTSSTSTTLTVDLPADNSSISFDATVESANGIVSVDTSVSDASGCQVSRSDSGVRLQVAGDIDPKGGGCLDLTDYNSVQVTPDIPEKDTSVYGTRNGDSTAYPGYKVLHQVTLCLRRSDDRTISLSGSADGTRPWMVDNILLIETFDDNPEINGQRTGAYMAIPRQTPYPSDAALSDGTQIEIVNIATISGEYAGGLSPSPFTHPAGVVQLDDYMPVGDNVWIRFTGLDSGVEGRLSRIFLNSAEADETVPSCRTYFGCPEPDIDNYSGSWATAGGCIDGACAQNTCTSTDECPTGQRCASGFCTDGCDDDTDCPGGLTCEGRSCVDLSADGCADYTDCPVGEVCEFSTCTPGCYHPRQQQPDYSENYSSGFCKNNPDGCPRCGTQSDTCWNNYCRDCEIDAHCGSGERCVEFECVP